MIRAVQPDDRPRLRPLEIVPYAADGHDGVLLTDPDCFFEGQVFVPRGLLPVVASFTGERTIAEIAAELTRRHRQDVATEDVARIAGDLDGRLCLENATVARLRAERRQAFAALAVRPATHAGSAGYPSEAEACRQRLGAMLNGHSSDDARPIVGLVAPHIDLERGEQGYRSAYGALRQAPPADLYVLFGTCHRGPASALVPTLKHFATPLGVVETDQEFVRTVAAGLGGDPFAEEILHLGEHSLEFQVLFLKHVLGDRPFRIAPFVTGSLPRSPKDDLELGRLVTRIAEAVRARSERVTFVAGADLAHLGPFFGDPDPVDGELLSTLDVLDRHSLELLAQGDHDAFFAHVEAEDNPRRICGTTPMYLVGRLARALDPGCQGELLDYGQAVAPDGHQVVSFASLAFRSATRDRR
jgi:AmmeMemoRadiSam system protein B